MKCTKSHYANKIHREGDNWKTVPAPVKNIKGIHDLFFVFKGGKDLFNFDWWQFKK